MVDSERDKLKISLTLALLEEEEENSSTVKFFILGVHMKYTGHSVTLKIYLVLHKNGNKKHSFRKRFQ